jgi:hypothetical protein
VFQKIFDWVCIILSLLVISGCVTTSGTTASGSGTITNHAVFNITPLGYLPAPAGKVRADPGVSTSAGASATYADGITTPGSGNIIINFRQGSSENNSPAATAAGLSASVPAGGAVMAGPRSYGYK